MTHLTKVIVILFRRSKSSAKQGKTGGTMMPYQYGQQQPQQQILANMPLSGPIIDLGVVTG